jgi:hypothetical protein
LGDVADGFPPRVQPVAGKRLAIHQNRAGLWGIEPNQEVGERGLAGARRAGHPDEAARIDREIEVAQPPGSTFLVAVNERDRAELRTTL